MKIIFAPEFEKSLRRLVWRERLNPVNPIEWYRAAKKFYQRGRRGYADEDVWNFDAYLAEIIAARVDQLAANHWGYPPQLQTDDSDKGSAQWEEILHAIALGFRSHQELLEDYELLPDSVRYKELDANWEHGRQLFIEYFGSLWD